ncbi:Pyrophosphatase PpaX [Candidatus Bilamarchaeum dharawalense]|uniref:Pyrophosphatase PpaX n=1 Tax=Candidatus Bilamarchaeum dharawalense TaxID=2885759 RepID=A0A5E4LPG0_9ARCH|nr:Pyrophosphatase PpaX [Candidatus Bilamarchaeum dharawalense]
MIKLVIFDLDGVIYRGNTLIKGADKTVKLLKSRGIKTAYLTNACSRSRKGRICKMIELGLTAEENEMFTTSYAVSHYILENYPKAKRKVYYVGQKGVEEELKLHKIAVVDHKKADIVVVGWDPDFNYKKMTEAYRAVARGAEFIATNTDTTFPVEDGYKPGAGAMVASIACASGKKPKIVGKPNIFILKMILERFKVKKSEVLMVGDRLETDIAFGKKAGIKTALVLTGVSKKEDVKKIKPDYIFKSIADLPSIFHQIA